jgi:hypothetical protein
MVKASQMALAKVWAMGTNLVVDMAVDMASKVEVVETREAGTHQTLAHSTTTLTKSIWQLKRKKMYRKLTEPEVLTARNLYRLGLTCEEVGAKLGISGNAIHGLISGRSWGWLEDANGPLQLRRKGPRTGKAFQAKINQTVANEIRLELEKGVSPKTIAERRQLSLSTVYKIGQGKIWREQA